MVELKSLQIVALLSPLLMNCCFPSPSEQRGIKQGDTQVVAQWLEDGSALDRLIWTFTSDDHVATACGPMCFVDGNDLGSGTRNLYIYAQPKDVQKTVSLLIRLEREKRLPPKMRIGIAEYKDRDRSDWTYRAAYPSDLHHFDISYSEPNRRH